jgi:hypothetical protein
VAGPFKATVQMGGPYKIETKPYTIAVAGKPSTTAPEPSVAAQVSPAVTTAPAEIEASTTGETQAVKSGGLKLVVVFGVIAVIAAGIAVLSKKTTA